MRGRDWRSVFAVAFFLAQVGLVIEAQFGESRHFCWAPHTTQIRYSLRVEVGGRVLRPQQVAQRYGLRWGYGWEVHSIRNLMDLIVQREETYGRLEGARITLEYSVNGAETEEWNWPGGPVVP